MSVSPASVLLSFVDTSTGREITWTDGERSYWGRRRCSPAHVAQTCARVIPHIARCSGVPVDWIEGRVMEPVSTPRLDVPVHLLAAEAASP